MIILEPDFEIRQGGRVVSSSLYDSSAPAYLTQDLLLVALPGEIFIDVSWAPEHDPGGCYYVTVFRDQVDFRTATCQSPHAAIAAVEGFAAEFSAEKDPTLAVREGLE